MSLAICSICYVPFRAGSENKKTVLMEASKASTGANTAVYPLSGYAELPHPQHRTTSKNHSPSSHHPHAKPQSETSKAEILPHEDYSTQYKPDAPPPHRRPTPPAALDAMTGASSGRTRSCPRCTASSLSEWHSFLRLAGAFVRRSGRGAGGRRSSCVGRGSSCRISWCGSCVLRGAIPRRLFRGVRVSRGAAWM